MIIAKTSNNVFKDFNKFMTPPWSCAGLELQSYKPFGNGGNLGNVIGVFNGDKTQCVALNSNATLATPKLEWNPLSFLLGAKFLSGGKFAYS
jgi:hypothetical protein